jgi:DNA-directed RNA polymerase specialized sigma24 family protein
MSERLSNRRAVEKNLKKLRRFAVSVIGDQYSADAIVLDVIASHKNLLMPGYCPKAAFTLMLSAVYQRTESHKIKSRNTPLMNPLKTELLNVYMRFGSLNRKERAIISLLLIEEMSTEKISQIIEIPVSQVNLIIARSLEYLSGSTNALYVVG